MSKLAFVLVHGAWHDPSCWDKVKHALSDQGFHCVCPALPSTHEPPIPDLQPDVDVVRSQVEKLIDQGLQVIVVCHSYGGIPTGEALRDLDLNTRKLRGLPGGVVRLVYIMGFLVPEGFQQSPRGSDEGLRPFKPLIEVDIKAGIATVAPENAKTMFYQDMSNEEALELGRKTRPMSLGPGWSTTTFAAWRYIPTTYVICTKDYPVSIQMLGGAVERAQASEPHSIDQILEVESGHSPFWSQPDWTVTMLVKAASTIKDTT